jgi:hypothetical protein
MQKVWSSGVGSTDKVLLSPVNIALFYYIDRFQVFCEFLQQILSSSITLDAVIFKVYILKYLPKQWTIYSVATSNC